MGLWCMRSVLLLTLPLLFIRLCIEGCKDSMPKSLRHAARAVTLQIVVMREVALPCVSAPGTYCKEAVITWVGLEQAQMQGCRLLWSHQTDGHNPGMFRDMCVEFTWLMLAEPSPLLLLLLLHASLGWFIITIASRAITQGPLGSVVSALGSAPFQITIRCPVGCCRVLLGCAFSLCSLPELLTTINAALRGAV